MTRNVTVFGRCELLPSNTPQILSPNVYLQLVKWVAQYFFPLTLKQAKLVKRKLNVVIDITTI